MKGREGKGPPSADLLVCFPSRAHLSLIPKQICSPARASESTRRRHHHHHHYHHHHSHQHYHLKKSIERAGSAGQSSPFPRAKTKPMTSEIAEPTSPKVTCAGQIKIKQKPNSCKNWQSVMEEIERLHNNRKQKKKHTWAEALGLKKDIMQFLTCLRIFRLDFRCLGALPTTSDIASDEDEDDDEEEEDDVDFQHKHTSKMSAENGDDNDQANSRTVFSKWFMVLQENQTKEFNKSQNKDDTCVSYKTDNEEGDDDEGPCAPPPNALLLMRSRSAPAKSWLEELEEEEQEEEDEEEEERKEENEEEKAQLASEEEKKKKEDSILAMRYNTDFSLFSTDIVKETWLVGGIEDPLSRCKSWKR